MSTTAKKLLGIMRVRLSMLDEGIIKPSLAVSEATRQLVERLSVLPPGERIRIEYTTEPFHAQYIRNSTNELLAEFWQHGDA